MAARQHRKRTVLQVALLAGILVLLVAGSVARSLASSTTNGRASSALAAAQHSAPQLMASGIGPQVDTSNADLYVNRFIKRVVETGDRHVMASGSWWGPPAQFAQNQLWVVAKDVQPGKAYEPGSLISGTYTCLEPGKVAGHGTVSNTLDYPTMNFNLASHPAATLRPSGANTLEQFHTLTVRAPQGGSIEERYRCLTRETAANPFHEANVPSRMGNTTRTNFDAMIWFGKVGSRQSTNQLQTGNHLGLPTTRTNLMDAHAWYTGGVEYAYSVPLNAADLFGKTVSGVITVQGFALACRKPACSHTDATPIDVYHHALKIDVNDKDYWVAPTYMHMAAGKPLPASLSQKSLVTFKLDTRLLADGWHILSYHMHVIDHRQKAGFDGKQLASEVKLPICVDNHHRGGC
ncbi:MAG: hypothetical protein JWO59_1697 [Chloroflexi bacterium]|nr:hypothetical protein [Chloroflexota bacterium]